VILDGEDGVRVGDADISDALRELLGVPGSEDLVGDGVVGRDDGLSSMHANLSRRPLNEMVRSSLPFSFAAMLLSVIAYNRHKTINLTTRCLGIKRCSDSRKGLVG
jgi:hypothetical protein